MAAKWKPRKRDVISIERCKMNDGRTRYRLRWQPRPGDAWQCYWCDSRSHAWFKAGRRYEEILDNVRPTGIASIKPVFGKPPP